MNIYLVITICLIIGISGYYLFKAAFAFIVRIKIVINERYQLWKEASRFISELIQRIAVLTAAIQVLQAHITQFNDSNITLNINAKVAEVRIKELEAEIADLRSRLARTTSLVSK